MAFPQLLISSRPIAVTHRVTAFRMAAEKRSLSQFWTPGYWFAWVVYSYMRLIVYLPLAWQLAIGRQLGRCLNAIVSPKRQIAERNLAVCFPELSKTERTRLRDKHFESIGMCLSEMSMAWFGSEERIREVVTINGIEHLDRALEKGSGVILFSAHFTTVEFPFAALKPHCPNLCAMYRDQPNEMWNAIMQKGRRRNIDELFPKNGVRAMVKALMENAVVWYAPDQSYGGKHSALVPFFGVPAMTNTATSRIASMTGATVLPYFYKRCEENAGYVIDIGAPLDDFPTDDLVADTMRLTKALTDYVRQCPEQYWWTHQRFKGRPAPYPDVYRSQA